jgi:GT2 family glycosyltransferase
MQIMQSHVYVILLNWNGWQDTLECLESVYRLQYPRFVVIVCDNASSDGSIEKIEDWAKGKIISSCEAPDLRRLVRPPISKPIALNVISSLDRAANDSADAGLILIQTGGNLGFAGGNNVGIRYALAQNDCDYVWLLNNDTVVEPDSLSTMVQMADADPWLGICGSQLRNYHFPHDVQTMGGRRYSRWSGRTRPLREIGTPRISTEPGSPDYVEGASMLISRRCLETIGLLRESYFLYCEEIDLVARAQSRFRFGYAPESIVYHKEGASTGSSHRRANRSTVSDFYQARSRIDFVRLYHPWFLPSVVAAVIFGALQRVAIGKPGNAGAMLKGVFASLTQRHNRDRFPR